MKRYLGAAGWALGMLVLILDGQTALAGAAEGVTLCIKTLIPSLFPFFLLSAMLTSSLSGGGLLLSGLLGGYPVGAGNVAAAYRCGQIDRPEAERLVVLCNCAGPSFLFGVMAPVLGGAEKAAMVWLIYLLSIFALWIIFPKSKRAHGNSSPITLQQGLYRSLLAMAGVCGWVILFRVLLAVLDRWLLWLVPDWGQVAIYGVLELSNGCITLSAVEPKLRFILAAGMAGFGGICVMLQTAGVAEGISLRLYFPGKAFQGLVSALAASFLVPGAIVPAVQAGLAILAVICGWFLRKVEKRCGNPGLVGV